MRRELSELGKKEAETPPASADQTERTSEPPRPTNGRVDQIKEQAGASESAGTGSATAATGSVRPSMESAGFATPSGSQSHDGEHAAATPLTQATPSTPVQEATHDSATTVAPPTSPPRPPKNGQRTPSRQNSKEPVISDLSKSVDSQNGQPANLVEKIAQAAPSLQNIVPGTGAAKPRGA